MNGETGRVLGELGSRTRRVVYGEPSPTDLAAELSLLTKVDRAHVVMLAERGLIVRPVARRLLGCIDALAADNFRPLYGRPAPRGFYLMYEGYLIERLGAEVGGVLHTGRSRNDLKATMTLLRLRDWLLEFVEQATRLEAVLLSRAGRYRSTLMPAYTHFQAAMPVTYGYYLLGVALAVGREIDAMAAAAPGLGSCPLGAGAVAGTDLPIDSRRTARLLGFSGPVRHALDAVASRDVALRLLATGASLTVTLSRLATDLQLWSTAEFGFIRFPDRLVGGSSAMPQKRNAFLLEHVKAKPSQVLGAWAGAASAMACTPFTNTIEVGTEAVEYGWAGLRAAEQSVSLCQVLASGARPLAGPMAQRAETGFTAATAVANRLVRGGVPFRTAHTLVGEAVRTAIESGLPPAHAFGAGLAGARGAGAGGTAGGSGPAPELTDGGDLAGLVRAHAYGGGPGGFATIHQDAVRSWLDHQCWHRCWRAAQAEADNALALATSSIMDTR